MAKKDFLLEMGERTVNPESPDVLLTDKISERKRKQIARQEEEDEAAHTAKMADLAKKTASSERAVDKPEEKKETESPFKFTGGVNLGTIDLQEERKEAREQLERMKREADDAAKATGQENQQLRDKVHEQEIKVLQISFEAQMQILTKMIEGNASRGNFTDQLTAAREIAKELGYSQGTPGGGTEMIHLELKKLDFEHQIAMRKMNKDDKAEEKRWQLDLRRLDDERDSRKAELARLEKRDGMFATLPQRIGGAIAQGLMASEQEGGGIAEAPKGKQPGIITGVGESGEAACGMCGQPIAIGPTAKSAVCASCGTKYPIKRVKAQPESVDDDEE